MRKNRYGGWKILLPSHEILQWRKQMMREKWNEMR
jgi:hypothetical protein